MPVQFLQTIPVLRIFSVDKAKEFYIDFLGFQIDWEHRFDNVGKRPGQSNHRLQRGERDEW